MQQYTITENENVKIFRSEDFNYNFDKKTGYTELWGRTADDDPEYCKAGPIIADIEISDGNSCAENCLFCYKGNSKKGENSPDRSRNMSLDTFKKIFGKLPNTITQIAFGITSINANPDMFAIYDYCCENGVIPNMTISSNDIVTDEQVERIVKTCGAVAISIYSHLPKDRRYDLLKRIIKAGLKQVNIHYVISRQTIAGAYEICNDLITDPELKGVNAIVFLGLKPKNRGQAFDVLPIAEFTNLVNFCLEKGVSFGFDSCSAASFEYAVNNHPTIPDKQKKQLVSYSERCESSRSSAYFNVEGKYFHCSFGEDNEKGMGIDILDESIDFIKDIWNSPKAIEWREELKSLDYQCPLYTELHIENR